jgi:putative mRNA 3-end processing factor
LGHKKYVATNGSIPVIKYRLGNINISGVNYGETFTVNGVKISFHPAGHIIGSAQIRLEYKGEIWVASGDYKLEDDGVCTPFESIKCNHFITESTFGLPVFQWKTQDVVFEEINQWWKKNKEEEKVSILSTYALGKAQRVINNLDPDIGKIFTHGAIENTNKVLKSAGEKIARTHRVISDYNYQDFKGNMVLATPSGIGSNWVKKFKSYSVGIASGWMAMRGTRRRRAADRGFVLSDHADWKGLNQAIASTGAENIYVTHGYTDIFTKWLIEKGYNAQIVQTEFLGDEVVED